MITETSISSDEFIIEAPVEQVWAVLVDFDNYDEWNQFCLQSSRYLPWSGDI